MFVVGLDEFAVGWGLLLSLRAYGLRLLAIGWCCYLVCEMVLCASFVVWFAAWRCGFGLIRLVDCGI